MIPHRGQDAPLQGAYKLFKITSGCRNVIEFSAQEFPSLIKNLRVSHPFCAFFEHEGK